MGKKGSKIEVSAWVTACCRNVHVNRARYIAEIEILARIIWQVNG